MTRLTHIVSLAMSAIGAIFLLVAVFGSNHLIDTANAAIAIAFAAIGHAAARALAGLFGEQG